MQIKTTPKSFDQLAKGYVRLVLLEKGSERFVEKNGVSELHIVGGKYAKITPRTFRTLIRHIVQTAKKYKIEKLAAKFEHTTFPKLNGYDEPWMFSTIAENLMLADYEYTAYKSKPAKKIFKEILLCGKMSKAAKAGLDRGVLLGTHMNLCRDLANTPGSDMTPALLASATQKALKGTRAKVTVLNKAQITKLKMGGVLAVGQGAKDEPRFIIAEYWGAGKPSSKAQKPNIHKNNPIVFVGKGITFDTGGLQVKPGMAMYEMHMDMSGGAAVIAAVATIAKLGLKKNVIALVPAAENAVSGTSMRPGDVYTAMSGITVDVLHTDAEGRMVLADALHYAKRYEPRIVIDVATLTGAALVALGQHAHAVMTKDRALEDALRELGEESGDYVAPLPLWDEYKQYTKGVHADIANIPANDTRNGGTINGAAFLSHFTKGIKKWAHIDMAPRMTAAQGDNLCRGATGEPVRLLVKIAEKL